MLLDLIELMYSYRRANMLVGLIASSSRVAVDMISKLALHLLPVVEDFDYLAGYPWGQTSV